MRRFTEKVPFLPLRFPDQGRSRTPLKSTHLAFTDLAGAFLHPTDGAPVLRRGADEDAQPRLQEVPDASAEHVPRKTAEKPEQEKQVPAVHFNEKKEYKGKTQKTYCKAYHKPVDLRRDMRVIYS